MGFVAATGGGRQCGASEDAPRVPRHSGADVVDLGSPLFFEVDAEDICCKQGKSYPFLVNSPDDEMTLTLATLKVKKECGMKAFLLI
ncbi:hypothetical protein E2562_012364 [Oryza meyeriana var. granulata]|uniref:Uncharacterized protein n=1 Tax=Oryza meyeriana var. granulata TaxID=110450 RepID=A0A6G1DJI9_9ORYZ|nr:hypothetical protein E2562_012364 [Oryza meyeriana var. granulata]